MSFQCHSECDWQRVLAILHLDGIIVSLLIIKNVQTFHEL